MEGLKQVIEVRKVEKEYGAVTVALDGEKPNIVRSVYLTLDKPEDVANFPIGKKFNIVIAAAVLVLVFAIGAGAQGIPDAPSHLRSTQIEKHENAYLSPLKDPAFYIGVGNHAASALFDVHSTKVCEHTNPPQCAEAYPGHDTYRYVAPLIALEAAAQYGCSLMFYQHKRWRWGCLGISAAMSYWHWKDGSTIYHQSLVARR